MPPFSLAPVEWGAGQVWRGDEGERVRHLERPQAGRQPLENIKARPPGQGQPGNHHLTASHKCTNISFTTVVLHRKLHSTRPGSSTRGDPHHVSGLCPQSPCPCCAFAASFREGPRFFVELTFEPTARKTAAYVHSKQINTNVAGVGGSLPHIIQHVSRLLTPHTSGPNTNHGRTGCLCLQQASGLAQVTTNKKRPRCSERCGPKN